MRARRVARYGCRSLLTAGPAPPLRAKKLEARGKRAAPHHRDVLQKLLPYLYSTVPQREAGARERRLVGLAAG